VSVGCLTPSAGGGRRDERAAPTTVTGAVMKVIFSRKGFDSSAGGCPSPILEGRPLSLPIPTRMPSITRFRDLPTPRPGLVAELSRGRIDPNAPCHLDPDIDANLLQRKPGWRGALGQAGAAQGHLRRHRVARGDLFMFWGLFQTAVRDVGWQFRGQREHRIFGWLSVGDVLDVGPDPGAARTRYPWLDDHPHLQPGWGANNTVYIAAEELCIGGRAAGKPGWGVFTNGLRLTDTSSRLPSIWRVPDWLDPTLGGVGMTYHPAQRWRGDGTLTAAARGQEFIADIHDRPDAADWLRMLFAQHR